MNRNWLAWILTALLVALSGAVMSALLVAAAKGLPIPTGDRICFYPIASNWKISGMATHPFYSPIGSGIDAPFTWHGWLYPIALGSLAEDGAFASILRSEAHLIAAILILISVTAQELRKTPFAAAWILPITLAVLLSQRGRPELLATGWVWLALGPFRNSRSRHSIKWDGVLVGLTACTQPTVAALLGIALALESSLKYPTREAVRRIVVTAALSLLTFISATAAIHTYSVWDVVVGLIEHAKSVGLRPSRAGQFWQYYVANPELPLLATLPTLAAFRAIARRRQMTLLSVLIGGVAVVAIWRFAIRLPSTHYNITPFLPVVVYRLRSACPQEASPLQMGRLQISLVALCALACGLATTRTVYLLIGGGQELVTLADMRKAIDNNGGTRAFKLEDSLRTALGVMPIQGHDQQRFTLTMQSGTSRHSPPHVPGAVIVMNQFKPIPVTIGGLRIANTVPDYSFAAYRSITED